MHTWAKTILLPLLAIGIVFAPFSSNPAYANAPSSPSISNPLENNPIYQQVNGDSSNNSNTNNSSGNSNNQNNSGSNTKGNNTSNRTSTGTSTKGSSGKTDSSIGTGDIAGDALSCSVGSLIASVLTSAISGVLSSAVSDIAIPGLKVKVQDSSTEIRTFGLTIMGVTIPVLPSLDAIGYCLTNALITYIADATIAWIRGGFQGNPVFVDDPGQFFQGLVDYEISNFIGTLGNGVLCKGVDIQLQVALLQEATQSTGRQSSCSADTAMQRVRSGNFVTADYSIAYQDPKQLPINAYFSSATQLNSRISANLGVATVELDWNKGFLSFKDPDNPSRTVTPGQLIEKQLSNRIGLSTERLVLAEKFDQVISELVNSLIKIALDETFEAIGAKGKNYGAYEQYYQGATGNTQRPYLQ